MERGREHPTALGGDWLPPFSAYGPEIAIYSGLSKLQQLLVEACPRPTSRDWAPTKSLTLEFAGAGRIGIRQGPVAFLLPTTSLAAMEICCDGDGDTECECHRHPDGAKGVLITPGMMHPSIEQGCPLSVGHPGFEFWARQEGDAQGYGRTSASVQ